MYLKYFFAGISLVFLIQCTNAPSDLAKYKKNHYFDEITLQGVGIPTERQINEKEFVLVKSDNDLISVYYPYDDLLHNYYWKDSLWVRENMYDIENVNEKCFEKWYTRADSVLVYSIQCNNNGDIVSSSLRIWHKDWNIGVMVDNNFSMSKQKFDSIISNELNLENVKEINSNFKGSRKYYVGNYVLYYPVVKFMKNGELSYIINRSRGFEIDRDTFLKKYPEYRYKTNIRDL